MRLAPLALLGLLAVSGAPALSGCDQSPTNCDAVDTTFATEDLTPEGTELGADISGGDCVAVDYVGRLDDGVDGTFTGPLFDEGTLRIRYPNGVIQGFALGMVGMQVGETRRIRIPPNLAYSVQERRNADGEVVIPACSTLEFEVTVRAIYQDVNLCN